MPEQWMTEIQKITLPCMYVIILLLLISARVELEAISIFFFWLSGSLKLPATCITLVIRKALTLKEK